MAEPRFKRGDLIKLVRPRPSMHRFPIGALATVYNPRYTQVGLITLCWDKSNGVLSFNDDAGCFSEDQFDLVETAPPSSAPVDYMAITKEIVGR